MQETLVRFLGWEDSLNKGKATYSSILAWRVHGLYVHGIIKSWIRLSDFYSPSKIVILLMRLRNSDFRNIS